MAKKQLKFSASASRKLLYIVVLTLVFEGILRKLSPSFLKVGLFFLKDILCIAGMYIVLNTHSSKLNVKMLSLWRNITIAFLPLVIYTFFLSPPLSVFGAKEYLLYVVIALMLPLAFPKEDIESLKRFIFFISIMVIPTTIVAMLQYILPASSWLNTGVDGQSLAGFASQGKLRVSSTFSFTGQYSFFLNMSSSVLVATFFIPPKFSSKFLQRIQLPLLLIITILLIIGNFITGGRTAVLGSAAALALGFVFTANRFPAWFVTKGVLIIFSGLALLSTVRLVKPEYFMVYENRSKGSVKQSHSEEVETRMFVSFTAWMNWFGDRQAGAMIIGEGIGVMSNGVQQISAYAAKIRDTGFWTETDISTTLWEGGFYLALIWYSFRLYVVYLCFKMCQTIKSKKYATAGMFLLGYITVNGILGTLSIQPPLAIWFWMTVGIILTLKQCDNYLNNRYNTEKLIKKNTDELEFTVS